MRATSAVSLACLLVMLCGCSKKTELPPAAPGGGTSVGSVGTSQRPRADAGARATASEGDGGPAAAAPGSVLGIECNNVPATAGGVDVSNGDFVTAIGSPPDFQVTRVVAAWEASCAKPSIRIALSDGECPSGHGHELTFRLASDAIVSGAIHGGLNNIVPDNDALTDAGPHDSIPIRYVRPTRLEPSGTWGTCAGSSGTLDFAGDVDNKAGTVFQGRFDLQLTACDDSKNIGQDVTGTFSATLRRGVKDVCP